MTSFASAKNSMGQMERRIQHTMDVVRRILHQNKNPVIAADVDHQYGDKYSLVESLTNTGIAATLNVLQQMNGFNEEILKQVIFVVQGQQRSMTLRLIIEEECEFLEETTRTVESPMTHQSQVEAVQKDAAGNPISSSSRVYSHKTVTEVKEFHWKAGLRHRMILFAGTDASAGIELGTRTGMTRLTTKMKMPPYPTNTRTVDLDLTFLFKQIDGETLIASFVIDRGEAKTPRRNKQIEQALQFIEKLVVWSNHASRYFCHVIRNDLLRDVDRTEPQPADWLAKINSTDVFVPLAPLFQDYDKEDVKEETAADEMAENASLVAIPAPPPGSPLLPLKVTTAFLNEQARSLNESVGALARNFPDPNDQGQFVSAYEAKLVLLWLHIRDVGNAWRESINYVESMLTTQLVSAIGKEVQPSDFDEFVKFHNQRMFGKSYAPQPFCYAIRQPNAYPDGVVSIVSFPPKNQDGVPINTFSRHIPGDSLVTPMSIPLNAATTIDFVGDQYLHGWMDTHFTCQSQSNFFLNARARQFSCFLLMTGTISGPDQFTPKDAIILQNKDEILIPLLTTSLPSAKEFRDAIQSLSPEQARFAKSFRAMQLDSSIFGLCVIQVKPQMEALLDLPAHALMKEIQLTQDLLSLFVEYQIPPTLVSYDGDASATPAEKVAVVKGHVKSVLDVIGGMKENQLKEEAKKTEMHKEHLRQKQTRIEATEIQQELAVETMPRTAPAGSGPSGGFFGGPASSRFGAHAPVPMMKAQALSSCMAFAAPPLGNSMISAECETADADFVCDDEGFDTLQDQFSELDLQNGKDKKPNAGWMLPESQRTDFTAIPKNLDKTFESFDKDGALRTMTIKTGDSWTRKRQHNLLTKLQSATVAGPEKKTETNKALDLLDALSRSGSLPIASGELHVIVGVRHSFEQNVMATVIEENANPIEKVDYSSLLIGATIHQVDIPTLLIESAELPALVLKNREFPPLMLDADPSSADDEAADDV